MRNIMEGLRMRSQCSDEALATVERGMRRHLSGVSSVPQLPALVDAASKPRTTKARATPERVRRLHRGISASAPELPRLNYVRHLNSKLTGASARLGNAGEMGSGASSTAHGMTEAIHLQAAAVWELHAQHPPYAHAAAAVAAATAGLRVPGGGETVRVLVSHLSSDTADEARLLSEKVWPVLRERCAERHLRLLTIDPREGQAAGALPVMACMHQLEQCSEAMEGSPFVLFIQASSA